MSDEETPNVDSVGPDHFIGWSKSRSTFGSDGQELARYKTALRALVGDHDIHPAHMPDCATCLALNGPVPPTDAARLSHDRGADAERVQDLQQRWNAIVERPSLAAYEALVSDLWDTLDALRSVPAPTLPALDALRELSEKATPGPWWADVPGFGTVFQDAPTHDERAWLFDVREATNDDAALVVAAVNYVREALRDAV